MFTRFDAAGLLNAELGVEYRETVLARGGAVDGDVLVHDFLGRDPNSEAFLKNNGIE
jgi:Zn-dependent oligopeptidase